MIRYVSALECGCRFNVSSLKPRVGEIVWCNKHKKWCGAIVMARDLEATRGTEAS